MKRLLRLLALAFSSAGAAEKALLAAERARANDATAPVRAKAER